MVEHRVLMVCAGNICRSPTAEAVLRARLVDLGLHQRIGVGSAGTYPERGWPPDPRSIAAATRRGYDMSKIRARALDDADFELVDAIFAMDTSNLEALQGRCPATQQHKLELLLARCPRDDGLLEVPDPYYGGPEGFDRVLDLLEPACEALAHDLARRLG